MAPQNQSTERHWCLKAPTFSQQWDQNSINARVQKQLSNPFWNPLPPFTPKNTSQIISLRDKNEALYFTISSLFKAVIHVPFKENTAALIIVKPQSKTLHGDFRFLISALLSTVRSFGLCCRKGSPPSISRSLSHTDYTLHLFHQCLWKSSEPVIFSYNCICHLLQLDQRSWMNSQSGWSIPVTDANLDGNDIVQGKQTKKKHAESRSCENKRLLI